jgi:hypothetical protein
MGSSVGEKLCVDLRDKITAERFGERGLAGA